jgi:hypothetical protein
MAHKVESIPTNHHPFMTWLGNYLIQINGFISIGNAPDGYPYLHPRGVARWNAVVQPAIINLQGEWTPVSTKGNHTPTQGKQFTSDKELLLKTIFRPWNKSYVLYNDAFTVENRATIGILPVASSTRTASSLTMEMVFASLRPVGSCVYQIGCETVHESGRHSCPDNKIVQMSYSIVNRVAVGQAQPAPPLSPADCPMQGVSTHALFVKDFGLANAGKILYIYFRWFDLQHSEKSGPWSMLYTINLA